MSSRSAPNWRFRFYVVLFLAALAITYFAPLMFVTIPAGHGGVLYRRFQGGTVTDRVYPEGFHLVMPLNTMFLYDLRVQEKREKVEVLSNNGLMVDVTVSYRYHPEHDALGLLHKEIGPEYESKIVTPTIFASVREVVGKYKPEELYTTHRITVQEEIIREANLAVHDKHINFDAVLIRTMKLPPLINAAIERKLRQQQEYQEYEFRIAKEEREATRKRIEAAGIKDFQLTVSDHLSPELLQWRGIHATLELARSSNAKVVVVGGRGEGLGFPLIMGNLDAHGVAGSTLPERPPESGAADSAAEARNPGDLAGTTEERKALPALPEGRSQR